MAVDWPNFGEVKKVTAGTHRTCPFLDTVARVSPLLRTMGVTRVANVTGLDRLNIPVMMSIRPRSRGVSVQQGKGVTPEAAMASGIMESVESFAAEQVSPDQVWLTPEARRDLMMLPPHVLPCDLPADAVFACVRGFDLLADASVLVPEGMVRFDVSLPRSVSSQWFWSTTNGLAAGNTRDEALLHAICELVERDAEALWRLAPPRYQHASHFDPRTVADGAVEFLLDRFDAARVAVETWDITSDIGIPCFLCEIDDRHGTGNYLGSSGGAGCHPSVSVALCRALSEAAQTRLTGIAGSRDDMVPQRYAVTEWHRNVARLLFDDPTRVTGRPPPRAVSFDGVTVGGDLDAVLRRLRDTGLTSLVWVDLTEQALGIPCVRVVAPELEGPYRKGYYRAGPRATRWVGSWT